MVKWPASASTSSTAFRHRVGAANGLGRVLGILSNRSRASARWMRNRSAILTRAPSLARLNEISQIRRRLIPLGRHQEPIPAQEIIFLADFDLRIGFVRIVLGPVRARIWVEDVFLVDRPRARQGIVDHRHFVVQNFWIGFVAVNVLFENGLVVHVHGQAGFVDSAGALEAARLDLEHVIDAMPSSSIQRPIE